MPTAVADKTANQASRSIVGGGAGAAGQLGIVYVAVDNNQTTDGSENAVSSISDTAGNSWSRAAQFTNGQGTAQTGATVEIWYSLLTAGVGTLTINFSNATSRDASVVALDRFSLSPGSTVAVDTPSTLATDGAVNGAAHTLSGLTNVEGLIIRAEASEGPASGGLWGGATAGWTAITGAATAGSTAATNMALNVEWKVATGTSHTSDPTNGASSVDSASVMVRFREVFSTTPAIGGQTRALARASGAVLAAVLSLAPVRADARIRPATLSTSSGGYNTPTLVAHTSFGMPTNTSAAIDTTGATLLVVSQSGGVSAGPTDSYGNTWTPLTLRPGSGGADVRLYYVLSPTVGAGHTFTRGTGGSFLTVCVQAWSNVAAYESENGSSSNTSPFSPGSVTPVTDKALILAALADEGVASLAIDSSFTIGDSQALSGGNHYGGALGYLVPTAGAGVAVSPAWSWTGGTINVAGTTAVFTPTGSAAGPSLAGRVRSGARLAPATLSTATVLSGVVRDVVRVRPIPVTQAITLTGRMRVIARLAPVDSLDAPSTTGRATVFFQPFTNGDMAPLSTNSSYGPSLTIMDDPTGLLDGKVIRHAYADTSSGSQEVATFYNWGRYLDYSEEAWFHGSLVIPAVADITGGRKIVEFNGNGLRVNITAQDGTGGRAATSVVIYDSIGGQKSQDAPGGAPVPAAGEFNKTFVESGIALWWDELERMDVDVRLKMNSADAVRDAELTIYITTNGVEQQLDVHTLAATTGRGLGFKRSSVLSLGSGFSATIGAPAGHSYIECGFQTSGQPAENRYWDDIGVSATRITASTPPVAQYIATDFVAANSSTTVPDAAPGGAGVQYSGGVVTSGICGIDSNEMYFNTVGANTARLWNAGVSNGVVRVVAGAATASMPGFYFRWKDWDNYRKLVYYSGEWYLYIREAGVNYGPFQQIASSNSPPSSWGDFGRVDVELDGDSIIFKMDNVPFTITGFSGTDPYYNPATVGTWYGPDGNVVDSSTRWKDFRVVEPYSADAGVDTVDLEGQLRAIARIRPASLTQAQVLSGRVRDVARLTAASLTQAVPLAGTLRSAPRITPAPLTQTTPLAGRTRSGARVSSASLAQSAPIAGTMRAGARASGATLTHTLAVVPAAARSLVRLPGATLTITAPDAAVIRGAVRVLERIQPIALSSSLAVAPSAVRVTARLRGAALTQDLPLGATAVRAAARVLSIELPSTLALGAGAVRDVARLLGDATAYILNDNAAYSGRFSIRPRYVGMLVIRPSGSPYTPATSVYMGSTPKQRLVRDSENVVEMLGFLDTVSGEYPDGATGTMQLINPDGTPLGDPIDVTHVDGTTGADTIYRGEISHEVELLPRTTYDAELTMEVDGRQRTFFAQCEVLE